jgi:MOSC domain-containing protein YiiM
VRVAELVAVNLAVPTRKNGGTGWTGIDKRAADGPVLLAETGVAGDLVVDRRHHGTWYQAAYAYDVEDLVWWAGELGKPITPGSAGENLTLSGANCGDAVIGERWRLGGAVLRVTGPRMPCRVFSMFWDEPDLIKRFIARGRAGAYLAVEQAGEVTAGDELSVLSRPAHAVTVAEIFAVRSGARGALGERVRPALADLPPEWADSVAKKIA